MFNVPTPENDSDAFDLGKKIREWIKDGKLKPGETKDEKDDENEDLHKHDKEEKSKKKRGRFGFLRR